jgi:hypothetical protein
LLVALIIAVGFGCGYMRVYGYVETILKVVEYFLFFVRVGHVWRVSEHK